MHPSQIPGGSAVLVVEDDANDVEFIRRAFQRHQLLNPTVVFERAEDACDYLLDQAVRGSFPPVAIVDIYLPGPMDGLDFVHWVRSQPGPLSTLPVVFLTVATDRTFQSRASELGPTLLLLKPITPDVLVEAVKHLGLAVSRTISGVTVGSVIEPRGR